MNELTEKLVIRLPLQNTSIGSLDILFEPWAYTVTLEEEDEVTLDVLVDGNKSQPFGFIFRRGVLVLYPIDGVFQNLWRANVRMFDFR
jgi:hypothetical protein